jgi:hypothetical protein
LKGRRGRTVFVRITGKDDHVHFFGDGGIHDGIERFEEIQYAKRQARLRVVAAIVGHVNVRVCEVKYFHGMLIIILRFLHCVGVVKYSRKKYQSVTILELLRLSLEWTKGEYTMRKSTLILSIILTGVVLGLVFVLVKTYRKVMETAVPGNPAPAAEQAQSQQQTPSQNLADVPVAGNVRIYEAAAVAANVLGRKDVYITEYAQLNGAEVYLVSFLSGDLVYVSLAGEVISTSKQDPIGTYQPTSHRK